MQGGKGRFHPTQKSLKLFMALIEKHSNEGDVVLDTFLGAGTTALACRETKRSCLGSELAAEDILKMNECHFSLPAAGCSVMFRTLVGPRFGDVS